MRITLIPYGAILTLFLALASSVSFGADFTIGVLAKNGATKALKQWEPTAAYLSEQLPEDAFQIVPLDFDDVYPAIENRKVDFFLVNSSMFVTAKRRFGAVAIATMINSRQGQALSVFGGVILTYVDRDDIQDLADLKGKNFMAVKETSFGGWQMAYKELLDQGIDPRKDFASLAFGGKHENVVFAVQNGEVDAGTVRTDTLERMAASGDIGMDEFKILAPKEVADFPFVLSTALYPEWPMARTAGISESKAKEVSDALIAMPADANAAKAAKIVGWSEALDYAPVEALQQALGVVE